MPTSFSRLISGVAILCACMSSSPAQAQTTFPVAYIGSDGNVYIASDDMSIGTPITAVTTTGEISNRQRDHVYRHLRWSPDGSKLLFTDLTTNQVVMAESGKAPTVVASDIAGAYPAAWSPDGTSFAYLVGTSETVTAEPSDTNSLSGALSVFEIRIQQAVGSEAVVAGRVNVGRGCGGANFDPSARIYDLYAERYDAAQILEWLPSGYLVTTACTGQGTALIGTDGAVKWSNPALSGVVVAGDGSRAVGLDVSRRQQGGGDPSIVPDVVTVDLTTGASSPFSGIAGGYDAATLTTEAIVYAQASPIRLSATTGDPSQGAAGPFLAQVNTLSVVGLAFEQGNSQGDPAALRIPFPLFFGEGYKVAAISVAPDNSKVLLSVVPDAQALVDAANTNKTGADLENAFPKPYIVNLPFPLDSILNVPMQGGGFSGPSAGVPGINAVYSPVNTPFSAVR